MADASVKNAFSEYDALRSFGHTSPWFGGPSAAFTIYPDKEGKVFGRYDGVLASYDALKKMLRKAEDDLAKLKAALRGAQEDLGEVMVLLNSEIADNRVHAERLAAIGKILDGDYEIE